MREVSKEQLDNKIKDFESKGWKAEIIGDFKEGEKFYVTYPEGWRKDENYFDPKNYSKGTQRQREAIRFANLCKIHYKKYPECWVDSIY